jgi:hypothetical protein
LLVGPDQLLTYRINPQLANSAGASPPLSVFISGALASTPGPPVHAFELVSGGAVDLALTDDPSAGAVLGVIGKAGEVIRFIVAPPRLGGGVNIQHGTVELPDSGRARALTAVVLDDGIPRFVGGGVSTVDGDEIPTLWLLELVTPPGLFGITGTRYFMLTPSLASPLMVTSSKSGRLLTVFAPKL